jgi:nitrogen permease regulator 2-like protein
MCPLRFLRYFSTDLSSNYSAVPGHRQSFASLLELYCSLRQGKTLRDWITEHRTELTGIDIRRFISFGVIKGFLYRVHRYPIIGEGTPAERRISERRRPWLRQLDGRKHMDALCTMLESSVRDIEDQLSEVDNVQWIWR